MNRTEHLVHCANAASLCNAHFEHVIVDWSSTTAVSRDLLPKDQRIRLIRVEGETYWHASRAYNFAVGASTGSHAMRLDADQLVSDKFFQNNYWNIDAVLANDFTIGDALVPSSTGLFFVPKDRFMQAGGFSEYLVGWGYEDLDLLARLRGYCRQLPLDLSNCTSIDHDDALRGIVASSSAQRLPNELRKSFSNARNKWLAQAVVWNAQIERSTYAQADGKWRANFVPALPTWITRREAEMVPKIELEGLFKAPIEITAAEAKTSHRRLMTSRKYRIAVPFTLIVRLQARLVNWILRKMSN